MEMRDLTNIPGVAHTKSAKDILGVEDSVHDGDHKIDPGVFSKPQEVVDSLGIVKGMSVADFGAGSGAYSLGAADLVGDGGRVYAIDVQKDLLTKLKNTAENEGHKNLEIVWGDIETVGGSRIADNLIDVVILANTLFQLEKKEAVLAEGYRVLRPGGTLALIDWSESFGGMGPPEGMVVTKEHAAQVANNAGFEMLHDIPAGAHHYGVIFKKPGSVGARESAVISEAEQLKEQYGVR